jgi:hypothetical protein
VFKVKVIGTLGAGDVFHSAFALMLRRGERLTPCAFAAAAAAVKCTRFGITGAPQRADVSLAGASLAGNRLEAVEACRIVDQNFLGRRVRHPLRKLVEQQPSSIGNGVAISAIERALARSDAASRCPIRCSRDWRRPAPARAA